VHGAAAIICLAASVTDAVPAAGVTAVVRLAHVDPAFGSGGIAALDPWTEVRDLVELPDGRWLVRVAQRDRFGVSISEGLVRLHANGSRDATFASSSSTPGELTLPLDAGTGLVVRADGRIVLTNGVALQFTANGDPDLAFGNNGRGLGIPGGPAFELADGFVTFCSLQPPELGGLSLQTFSPTGQPDLARLVFTGFDAGAVIPMRRPDGSSLLIARAADLAAPVAGMLLAVRSDGTLDPGFGGGDGIAPIDPVPNTAPFGRMLDAALQPDGKVVAMMFLPALTFMVRVLRFNADGTPDASFGVNGHLDVQGFDGSVTVEPDGMIDLGLWYRFEEPPVAGDNPNKTFLVRVLPSGTVDTQFNSGRLRPGSVTLRELGVADVSGVVEMRRASNGDLLIGRSQFNVGSTSAQLVRLVLDVAAPPPPLRLVGAAVAGAPADRVGPVPVP